MFFTPVVPFMGGAAAYAGPGDIVATASGWWGLRAYSLASIGTNLIRLREDGGNTEQNFASIAGGGLDASAISAFKGANNLFVVKLYDQSGNGNDFAQATAGAQPAFSLTGGLSSGPVITFVFNTTYLEVVNFSLAIVQPLSQSVVANRISTAGRDLFRSTGIRTITGWTAGVPNEFTIHAGSFQTAVVADNAYHAIQVLFSGAGSKIVIDGSSSTVNPGTNDFSGIGDALELSDLPQGTGVDVKFEEVGVWAGDKSANFAALNTQQHSYYGF